MKKAGFMTTTSLALGLAFQTNAQAFDEAACLDSLAYDTERYSQALIQAFENQADGLFEKLGVAAMKTGLNLECGSVSSTYEGIKDCLNAAGQIEVDYMTERTEYWKDLQERFISLRDRGECLIPLHNYN